MDFVARVGIEDLGNLGHDGVEGEHGVGDEVVNGDAIIFHGDDGDDDLGSMIEGFVGAVEDVLG